MTQTIFDDNVIIDGTQDEVQLDVQGYSSQDNPLQTWKDSSGNVLSEILGDGRIHAGDDLGAETEDAFIEVHRETSTLPKRGIGTLGKIAVAASTIVQWIAHELRLTGSTDIDDQHTAIRVQLTNETTGKLVSGGELRAGDFEVVNNAGDTPQGGTAIGLRAAVHNTTNGVVNEAIGLEVDVQDENDTTPIPNGNITGIKINDVGDDNIALQIGTGKVGVGTDSPIGSVHITRSDQQPAFYAERVPPGAPTRLNSFFGGGDSAWVYTVNDAAQWVAGIDDDDGDQFKFSYGASENAQFGVNDYLQIASNGKVTVPVSLLAALINSGSNSASIPNGDVEHLFWREINSMYLLASSVYSGSSAAALSFVRVLNSGTTYIQKIYEFNLNHHLTGTSIRVQNQTGATVTVNSSWIKLF